MDGLVQPVSFTVILVMVLVQVFQQVANINKSDWKGC